MSFLDRIRRWIHPTPNGVAPGAAFAEAGAAERTKRTKIDLEAAASYDEAKKTIDDGIEECQKLQRELVPYVAEGTDEEDEGGLSAAVEIISEETGGDG